MSTSKRIGFILGPLVFIIVRLFFKPEGLSDEANAILASTLWIAIWWITEAIPIAVTALLPIILFPLTGGLDLNTTTSAFGHKFIFLFLGGFMIAIAIEKWNLHKRIALNIINFIGLDAKKILLGFMVATGFISMWISNTATAVMMLPIGIAILTQLKDKSGTEVNENAVFGKALMLAIAYSASIGGMATLVGTPPNLILAGIISKSYGYEITFFQWFIVGFPTAALLLFICWKYLSSYAFKMDKIEFEGGNQEIKKLLNQLGPISYEEKIVGIVFAATAFFWITRSFIFNNFIPQLDDTIIAITFAVLLFIIPSKNKQQQLLNWNDAVKIPWGIILLFGGGMALANGFDSSGLALWIGDQMSSLAGLSALLLLFLIVAIVNFSGEVTSNTASTAMLLPILAPMALMVDMHPFILLFGATLASSCGFMLPAATPPNAVVFGAGYLRIPDMVSKGFVMNVISVIIITLFAYFLMPLLLEMPNKELFLNTN